LCFTLSRRLVRHSREGDGGSPAKADRPLPSEFALPAAFPFASFAASRETIPCFSEKNHTRDQAGQPGTTALGRTCSGGLCPSFTRARTRQLQIAIHQFFRLSVPSSFGSSGYQLSSPNPQPPKAVTDAPIIFHHLPFVKSETEHE
jgi:hypothetical protein